ncbi:single-stranded DNA-binding protein [Geothermobacter hydrogeniphilus]|uniref:Single-stranded DNA-binding protein n=1 Tax=Geothermobacter hydrogeniphilus TaxID=1969733 RepID=A0A1X0Y8G3_9BACT|nr:single-stranded DNA-binding protein [Geothermobacter hydrogeniphilus]ORJ61314.1 single-stranded DNA-binding protein [Geothermobacter hydrogeniphilus]
MLNEVRLIGRLGKDPDYRATPQGVSVTTFTLATWEKRKKDGEIAEKTEWHNIVTWRGLADTCHQFLSKGKLVFVEGKIQTRKYLDKDGNNRYITEIIADKVRFLDRPDGKTPEGWTEPPADSPYAGDIPF